MIRRWFRSPVTAIVIIVTVGVTVGGVATIFTAFDAVLLQDLPVSEPDRLVRVALVTSRGDTHDVIAWDDFKLIEDAEGPLRVAAFTASGRSAVRDPQTGEMVIAGVERVTDRFFDVMRPRMLRGSVPRSGERGAVVNERFAALSTIVINDVTYSVTGVASFFGTNIGNQAAIWIPLERRGPLENLRVRVMGRLADGASYADAERVLTSMLDKQDIKVRVGPERAMLIAPESPGMIRAALLIAALLALAVVFVAATNVIGVLIARVAVRRRELAVRAALGATRGRIVRELILEAMPLAVPAALLAQLVALAGSRLITLYLPSRIAPPIDFTPGLRVGLFAAALSLIATAFAGAAAAFHARRLNAEDLGARGSASGAPLMLRTLVVVQLAFTAVVLITAALLLQTARAYRSVDPGFESVNQLTVSHPEVRRYADRVRAVSGVTHVVLATSAPMGRQDPAPITIGDDTRDGHLTRIEGDYFGASGIALLRGRNVLPNETTAAVVNESTKTNIGESVVVRGVAYIVVGVARDARMSSLAESPRPHVWTALEPERRALLLVRTTRDVGAVTRDIAVINPEASVTRLHDVVESDRWVAQTSAVLAGALGALTLLLAAVGLFGVVSTIVTSRKRELAVRMALGATPRVIARLIAKGSARLLIFGLVLGAALAIPAARGLASFLFGVHAFDAASWLVVPSLIAIVVTCATAVPAVRAMRTDPADVLQEL